MTSLDDFEARFRSFIPELTRNPFEVGRPFARFAFAPSIVICLCKNCMSQDEDPFVAKVCVNENGCALCAVVALVTLETHMTGSLRPRCRRCEL